jgi:hypothetical protein
MRQGVFKSIISFKQRYNNALKAYNDQKNPVMKPEDIAMDFFSRLDNVCYQEFKTTFINGLQIKSVKPLKDLNEIFTLANMYLKPKFVAGSGGMGSMFATTADIIERKPGDRKGREERIHKVMAKTIKAARAILVTVQIKRRIYIYIYITS